MLATGKRDVFARNSPSNVQLVVYLDAPFYVGLPQFVVACAGEVTVRDFFAITVPIGNRPAVEARQQDLWFVTAERVREGNSPEGDDVASITGRSRDIPGTYARCEHKSSGAVR